MTSGISRRAFARTRGISEATVRGHIASGLLAEAVREDGLLDPVKADQLLAEASPKTQRETSPTVKAARRRKLIAQTQRVLDAVTDLRNKSIHVDAVEPCFDPERQIIATVMRTLPARTGAAAGKPIREAAELLEDLVNETMAETGRALTAEKPPSTPRPAEPELDALATAGVVAMKADLEAVQMEIERGYAHGELVDINDVMADLDERIAIQKSIVWGIPGLLAALAPDATADEIIERASAEVERSLTVLNPPSN